MATVVQIGAEAGAEKLAGWLEGRTQGSGQVAHVDALATAVGLAR